MSRERGKVPLYKQPSIYGRRAARLRNYHGPAVGVAVIVGILGLWAHVNVFWGLVYFGGALILGVVITECIRVARRRKGRLIRVIGPNRGRTAAVAPPSPFLVTDEPPKTPGSGS